MSLEGVASLSLSLLRFLSILSLRPFSLLSHRYANLIPSSSSSFPSTLRTAQHRWSCLLGEGMVAFLHIYLHLSLSLNFLEPVHELKRIVIKRAKTQELSRDYVFALRKRKRRQKP